MGGPKDLQAEKDRLNKNKPTCIREVVASPRFNSSQDSVNEQFTVLQ